MGNGVAKVRVRGDQSDRATTVEIAPVQASEVVDGVSLDYRVNGRRTAPVSVAVDESSLDCRENGGQNGPVSQIERNDPVSHSTAVDQSEID